MEDFDPMLVMMVSVPLVFFFFKISNMSLLKSSQ